MTERAFHTTVHIGSRIVVGKAGHYASYQRRCVRARIAAGIKGAIKCLLSLPFISSELLIGYISCEVSNLIYENLSRCPNFFVRFLYFRAYTEANNYYSV